MKTVLMVGCGETVTDWQTVNIRMPFYTIARLRITTWHAYLIWDWGMHVMFEFPPYSNPPCTFYNWAHSGCDSSSFYYIYVVVVLWMSWFELIRVRCILIRSYSSLTESHSCSDCTTSHCVLVIFNMHEWRSMQCEWPEYSTKAVRHIVVYDLTFISSYTPMY